MEECDEAYCDLEVPADFTFGRHSDGEFSFGVKRGWMDYRVGLRDGAPPAKFSWQGHSDADAGCDCGWRRLSTVSDEGISTLTEAFPVAAVTNARWRRRPASRCSRRNAVVRGIASLCFLIPVAIVSREPLRQSVGRAYARRMHSSQLVTAEDLERTGRAGFSYELVGGRLVRVNPPNHEHGRIALDLGAELRRVVRANDLGHVVVESGYTLTRNPDTVRGPDVSFVRKGRPNYPPASAFFVGSPDLAVEVRSPDDTIAELLGKAAEYLDAGAELVWIVDPEDATVRVLRRGAAMVTLGANDVLEGATTVPGFQLPLGELFAPLRPSLESRT